MDKYVFLKVLENQDQVMIDPEYVIVPLLLHHDLRVFDYKRFLWEFHDKFFPRITCLRADVSYFLCCTRKRDK